MAAEYLRPLGARLGRKAYNGRVKRRHRTDDEAFYLPCVLSLGTVGALLSAGLGWMVSVCIRVMGWRVKRRMRVVWRWGFMGRGMRV
jgi:hypothetical protein